MANNLEEQVSALVDGELPHEEVDNVFSKLKQDDAAQACWRHYHLISDALKNNLPEKLPEDFVNRVSLALESEPALLAPPVRRRTQTFINRPTIGFALAASVAAVAFLGLGWNNQTAVEQMPSLAANMTQAPAINTSASAPVVSYTRVQGGQWDVEQPAVVSKLNDYLLSHDQYSSVAGVRNGVLPQVRIVGYERPEGVQQDPMAGSGR